MAILIVVYYCAGSLELVDQFLEFGADAGVLSAGDTTPFLAACAHGHYC